MLVTFFPLIKTLGINQNAQSIEQVPMKQIIFHINK